jgi:hypothetical protein
MAQGQRGAVAKLLCSAQQEAAGQLGVESSSRQGEL